MLLDECGLPADHAHVVTGGGGTVGNAIVDHADIAMITFTGSPEVGWGIKAQAPRKKVGLELGNNAPLIIEPSADVETAAKKVSVAGFSHAGPVVHLDAAHLVHEYVKDAFLDALVPLVEGLVVGDPLDERTDVSALISTKRARPRAVVGRRSGRGGRRDPRGRQGARGRRARADGARRRHARHEGVRRRGVRPGRRRRDLRATSTRRSALANDTRYGLQAAIFTADLGDALRAARTLDFGGVLVNEVPTFRADQQPYGGVRDSGNTREGPQWAVREMTEERLVIIQL